MPPLLTDYVNIKDLGKGNAIYMIGNNIGAIFSMSVLFTYTRDMDPKISYSISASMIGVLAIISLFLVKEPTDVKIEKPSCKGLWTKVYLGLK